MPAAAGNPCSQPSVDPGVAVVAGPALDHAMVARADIVAGRATDPGPASSRGSEPGRDSTGNRCFDRECPSGFPHQGQGPPPGLAARAVASLVLAIVAPFSLALCAPFASFAMLLTFPYEGPSAAPLVFWSMPFIFGLISTALALTALRKWGTSFERSGLAVAALWISGVIFVIGLIFTLRFMYLMQLG
jgi:hypothetical protein